MSILNKLFGKKETKEIGLQEVESITDTIEEPIMDSFEESTEVVIVPSTIATRVRRNGTPDSRFYEILDIASYAKSIDTIIVQYNKPYMLSSIQNHVRKYATKNATSQIRPFIDIDVFVNLAFNPSFIDPNIYSGKKWIRVVYEMTDGNTSLSAISRFPECLVVKVDETFTKPKLSLDMLIEGRR